ncbi:MAG: biopolymer transporter ExbD [Geitlerinemataceae cyanobacterium]
MGFKARRRTTATMPEVQLVPMMDVLMSILAFFIVVSMTLTRQQSAVDVTLPGVKSGTNAATASSASIVVLDAEGRIWLGDRQIVPQQLESQIATYLRENPTGTILLKADRQLPYEQVIQLLGQLRSVGGERVSLAISEE